MTFIYRIVKMLSRIEVLLSDILTLMNHLKQHQKPFADQKPDDEIYLNSTEVMRLLKISSSILYRHKKSKILVPTAVNGKFYRKSDLIGYEERVTD